MQLKHAFGVDNTFIDVKDTALFMYSYEVPLISGNAWTAIRYEKIYVLSICFLCFLVSGFYS